MPGSELAALRDAARSASMREAGEIARATAARPFKRWTKGDDNSPVSEADIAVNDFLRARLAARWRPTPAGCRRKPRTIPRGATPPRALDRRSDRRHARLSRRPRRLDHFGRAGRRRPAAAGRALCAGDRRDVPRAARQGATLNGAPITASAPATACRRPARRSETLSRPLCRT